MMIKIPCAIVLIAFAAMGSVSAQDIEPQYIPRPSTTEGPEKDTTATVTENSNSITTSKDFETHTQTELMPTVTTATETDDTTTEVIGTTTEDVIPKDTTTDIAPTEAEDASTEATRTTTEGISTTTITPDKAPTPRPDQTPSSGGAALNCRITLVSETPYYNWILGAVIVPKTCSYCCAIACIQKCIEIEPFYCIG